MNRKEFIERCLMMGISLPLLSSLMLKSCSNNNQSSPQFQTDFKGKVLVIGAGVAGLSAGYLLNRYGVDFQIVEASSIIGGRVKKNDKFADFPIDIGAEWIHTEPEILNKIVNNPNIKVDIDIIDYNPKTIKAWDNGELSSHNYISYLYSEWKFKNTTWFDFFDRYIVPDIYTKISLNKNVNEINYIQDKIFVKTIDNEIFVCDKVLVTSSIKTLQEKIINFIPELDKNKQDAIAKIYMGDGIKIFVEFKEKFYPDMLSFGNIYDALDEEEKFVYDAAFGKESAKNILGLFAINQKANDYTQLSTEKQIIEKFLSELDEIFDGKASQNYINHIIQNWSKEPFIKGAYSYSFEGNKKSIIETIEQPIHKKVYFAGEALSYKNSSMVHGACQSAFATIEKMMQDY